MGNTNGKESRDSHGRRTSIMQSSSRNASQQGLSTQSMSGRYRSRHSSRHDAFSTLAGAQDENQPFKHKETRAEKEARRREKERVLREQERERSMQLERVDGGYLVTLGTYIGPEDFSKPVVRQLIIERRMAPFWRGLNDVEESWTDAQLVAMVRGLDLPEPDADLPEDLLSHATLTASAPPANFNAYSLTVPIGARSQSVSSAQTANAPPSSSGGISSLRPGSSHFRSRKSLAQAIGLSSSRNSSQVEVNTPQEINLPVDPFVNGKPLEVFLYRGATECPICFIMYPPFLNHTRCCDQPICSECFVQIKRPDPHFPEHHGDGEAEQTESTAAELLVSEPAQCPYCQQPEFGVTYEPPPFRRGIVYDTPSSSLGHHGMSSRTSLNSTGSPLPSGGRRRTQSLSASNPLVITTDRVRPDWAGKLAHQQAHLARRSAAATALHNAAFLMANNESRNAVFSFGRSSRRSEGLSAASVDTSPTSNHPTAVSSSSGQAFPGHPRNAYATTAGTMTSGQNVRMGNVNELENMMMAEAMRLSIMSEEERRRKAEKEAQKAAEKEAKKEAKKAHKEEKKKKRTSFYSLGFGHGSSSSHPTQPVGQPGPSNVPPTPTTIVTPASDPLTHTHENLVPAEEVPTTIPEARPSVEGASLNTTKGKSIACETSSASIAIANADVSGQASNSSSPPSSIPDSYTSPGDADPHTSSTSVENHDDEDPGNAGNEPMFNYRSLAEIVGVDIENGSNRPGSASKGSQNGAVEHAEHIVEGSPSETVKVPVSASTNEVVATPSLS
ncbi:hypothetical protein TD95_000908 [Thielaviopsis punctulata]|uniref:Uncharacterized protein n=1 Tax=Thielaviopsis punctulata TaxID=72032 RepID=A0A0F4ZEE7_9PEZI|nr:hypothetical protein TD95_000908 [Thielaviopsis punctulata]